VAAEEAAVVRAQEVAPVPDSSRFSQVSSAWRRRQRTAEAWPFALPLAPPMPAVLTPVRQAATSGLLPAPLPQMRVARTARAQVMTSRP
jgi:hypothetical protein